ncbi:hypothetical protein [Pseudomonas sp. PI1]|uniref:hypothetical protein n=1 Tax=Pseudomonas sp. PI1 TaxID=1582493 RepID=UPI00068BCC27|nr:hypothetical protein [Pseudomonas sp. PI1]KWR82506.1 hypothetical protein RN02_08865 [Pseudomonas sp. PI1]
MKPANYAPVYACVYAQLAEVARQHGYALSIHGSLAADFDLVCIPWAKEVSEPQAVVDQITREFAIEQVTGYEQKEHGRIATTISFSFGECRLDLSFMPRADELARLNGKVVSEGLLRDLLKSAQKLSDRAAGFAVSGVEFIEIGDNNSAIVELEVTLDELRALLDEGKENGHA